VDGRLLDIYFINYYFGYWASASSALFKINNHQLIIYNSSRLIIIRSISSAPRPSPLRLLLLQRAPDPRDRSLEGQSLRVRPLQAQPGHGRLRPSQQAKGR
jgi:hypothetical protein